VRKGVESGDLLLHGAYFGVAVGSLSVLDKVEKVFKPVGQAKPAD
jgi:carbonic anhydrase